MMVVNVEVQYSICGSDLLLWSKCVNFPFERMEWAVIFLNGLYLSSTGLEADLWAYQVDAYTIRR